MRTKFSLVFMGLATLAAGHTAVAKGVEPVFSKSEVELFELEKRAEREENAEVIPTDITSGWFVSAEPKFVLLHGEVVTPIAIKDEYTMEHADWGHFRFNDGKIYSASKTPIMSMQHVKGNIFHRRPTLFISLHGASVHKGAQEWQFNLDAELVKNVSKDSQYKHFIVSWDGLKPLRGQVKDLSKIVQKFIQAKVQPWDVVIIGHSRGGIFAHELSESVAEMANVEHTLTVLLDPTAAIPFGDTFPRRKPGGGQVKGYNFYDQKGWLAPGLPGPVATVSDQSISGYSNQTVRGTNHDDMPNDWLYGKVLIPGSFRFASVLSDLNRLRPYVANSYAADGESGSENIKLSERDINFDGDLNFEDGQLSGFIQLDMLNTSQSFSGYFGADSAEVTANLLFTSTYASLQMDRAELSQSTYLDKTTVAVSKHGVKANISHLGIIDTNVKADLKGFALQINTGIGSVNFSDPHGGLRFFIIDGNAKLFGRAFSSIKNKANKVGDKIAKTFGW